MCIIIFFLISKEKKYSVYKLFKYLEMFINDENQRYLRKLLLFTCEISIIFENRYKPICIFLISDKYIKYIKYYNAQSYKYWNRLSLCFKCILNQAMSLITIRLIFLIIFIIDFSFKYMLFILFFFLNL